jgi:hypothetical protein
LNSQLGSICVGLLSLSIASYSIAARAAVEHPFVPPKIFKKIGKPVEVTWPDGRKAKMIYGTNPPMTAEVPFLITDNQCTGIVDEVTGNLGCRIKTSYKAISLSLRWTSNPDPTKIGKVVIRHADERLGRNIAMHIGGAIISTDVWRYPRVAAGIPSNEITCDDYSWLPGSSGKTAPKKVHLYRWSVEYDLVNPETKNNENGEVGDAFDLDFNRLPDGHLKNDYIAALSPVPAYPIIGASFGNNLRIALSVRKPDGSSCLVQTNPHHNPSLVEAQRRVTAERVPDERLSTFVYGKDEVYESLLYEYRKMHWILEPGEFD